MSEGAELTQVVSETAAPVAAEQIQASTEPESVPAVVAAPAKAEVPPENAAKPKAVRRKAAVTKAPAAAREVKPAVAPAPKKSIARKSTKSPIRIPVSVKAKPAAKPARTYSKEKIMAKTTSTDFLASIQSAFAEMQGKAKTAYDKGTAAFGDANDFAKGNVEAVVESSKILASGLQEMGSSLVTESRSAFDTMTAEVKELAAVKSPTEFFALQSKLARKNFDAAVAQASKNTEAMLKLVNDVVTPISGRVTLAVEKASKAA